MCVDVQLGPDTVRVRDSKDTGQPVIAVSAMDWTAFQAAVVVQSSVGTAAELSYRELADGSTELIGPGATFVYTADEWQAFVAGVHAEEFCVA